MNFHLTFLASSCPLSIVAVQSLEGKNIKRQKSKTRFKISAEDLKKNHNLKIDIALHQQTQKTRGGDMNTFPTLINCELRLTFTHILHFQVSVFTF